MEGCIILILYFAIYSFLGWMLETIFESLSEKKFVNRGFLKGCFCPLYGFGAILVSEVSMYLNKYTVNYYSWVFMCVIGSIILASALEYVTGYILEKLFNCKWWDYSDKFANINGYVCLEFSLLWGIIAFVFVRVVHPIISELVLNIPVKARGSIALVLVIYFVLDTVTSVIEALNLKDVIFNYSKISVMAYSKKIKQYDRFFRACPRLLRLNINMINKDVREILNMKFTKIKSYMKMEDIEENDYKECIKDLIENSAVQSMDNYIQHGDISCLKHCINVSYNSFLVCRRLGLDYCAAARGGLLHDMFLYDWHVTRPKEGMHGFTHPYAALKNANKYFRLSDKEKDIIEKHMWPLTVKLPKYRESFIVSCVDKYCAVMEVLKAHNDKYIRRIDEYVR